MSQESVAVGKPHKKIIMGILSAQMFVDRRIRCRNTWAVTTKDIEVLFLIGDPEATKIVLEGDVLRLPCPDDYRSLPQKVRLFCRWALEHREFQYLFKCDDDTFVLPERLLQHDFSGQYIGRSSKRNFAFGGPGYLLGPRAARVVAHRLTMSAGREDVLVGRVLHKHGITLTDCHVFGKPQRYRKIPAPNNDIISTHPVRNKRMYKIWKSLRNGVTPEVTKSVENEIYPLQLNPTLTIVDAQVAYGELGLNGELGHRVDGSSRLRLPSSASLGSRKTHYISAHAPSTITVRITEPSIIAGYMDLASWEWQGSPTYFHVDHKRIGALEKPGAKTEVIQLPAGKYSLKTTCDGQITRRYPIWSISSVSSQESEKTGNCQIEDAITFSRLGKHGRTGNQMFQYALLLAVAAKNNYSIAIPEGHLREFNLSCNRTSRNNLKKRKMLYRESNRAFNYDPKVFEQPAGTDYLGYFQSYLYFEGIENIIRKEFSFSDTIERNANDFISTLRSSHEGELVFVSARRGDYLKYQKTHIPFTKSYFLETREYFHSNVKYVVTSDDLSWAKENLQAPDVSFISVEDPMLCMSIGTKCDHHICSAGTYSWWAAWLCQNSAKTVIIPSPWYNPESCLLEKDNQMSPPNWIRHKITSFCDA